MATQYLKIVGYADRMSVRPGEKIRFMISCDGPKTYRADVVRIINGDLNPAGSGYKEEVLKSPLSGTHRGRKQPIHAGSYALVASRPSVDSLPSFTVQAMIWPTTPDKREQTLIAKWSERSKSGFQLMIDESGAVALKLGDGKGKMEVIATRKALLKREWYFVGASFDAKTKKVVVYQEPLAEYAGIDDSAEVNANSMLRRVDMGTAPITMAAVIRQTVNGRHRTTSHYNGKIDSPRLAGRAVSRVEMGQMMRPPFPRPLRSALLGAWDFALDIPSQRITDVSDHGLDGETINLPARAMTGYNWSREVWDWTAMPEEYGAIHFHDDDLYDAGWTPELELGVPKTWRSGCYALRLRNGKDEDYVPFYVRPPSGQATAKILFLAPTATYMAYANRMQNWLAPRGELLTDRLFTAFTWEQHLNENPELGLSFYDRHSDGSGCCYSSRLRPILNMRPKVMLQIPCMGSQLWGYNADTHLTDWLEAEGFEFDVLTDEDLHQEGMAALKLYRVVLTGTHPEYYSSAMLDAVKAYTDQGGRLMYLGGNGFYWRIAYHPSLPGVVEMRRGEGGTGSSTSEPGEYWQSFDGCLGGVWRFQDRAPQRVAGSGFIAQGFDISTSYRRTEESFDPRIKWAFEGIGRDELIGDFGLIGGGAAGVEVDIADRTLGTPPHALVVAKSEGLTDCYLLVKEQMPASSPNNFGDTNPLIRSDLVFYETPNGGAVFAFSSIAWCGSLLHNNYDNNVSRLTKNVLARFASDEPF